MAKVKPGSRSGLAPLLPFIRPFISSLSFNLELSESASKNPPYAVKPGKHELFLGWCIPVKLEFQMYNESFFGQSLSRAIFGQTDTGRCCIIYL